MGRVHGIRVTYYADGKTIRSKVTVNHGRKQGPSIWYYTNGKVFKHASYEGGKKHGLTRKYYRNGKLQAEFEYENGNALPGLKEYNKDGTVVRSFPEVDFREVNSLASKNWIDLEIFCEKERSGIKYFLLEEDYGRTSRVYLITEAGTASVRFYVKPGDTYTDTIRIISELPTSLGNVLVRKHTYHLLASNSH